MDLDLEISRLKQALIEPVIKLYLLEAGAERIFKLAPEKIPLNLWERGYAQEFQYQEGTHCRLLLDVVRACGKVDFRALGQRRRDFVHHHLKHVWTTNKRLIGRAFVDESHMLFHKEDIKYTLNVLVPEEGGRFMEAVIPDEKLHVAWDRHVLQTYCDVPHTHVMFGGHESSARSADSYSTMKQFSDMKKLARALHEAGLSRSSSTVTL